MKYLYIYILIAVIILLIIIYFLTSKYCKEIKFSNVETSCYYTRWGCCKDKITIKLDPDGTNCT